MREPHPTLKFRIILPEKLVQSFETVLLTESLPVVPELIWLRERMRDGTLKAKNEFDLTEEETLTFLSGLFAILEGFSGKTERRWFKLAIVGGLIGAGLFNLAVFIWGFFHA